MGYNRVNLERLDLLTGLGTSTKTATGNGTGIDLKDYEGAIADFTKAIEINPEDVYAYKSRGVSQEYIGNLIGACSDWRKASSLGDEDSSSWVIDQC